MVRLPPPFSPPSSWHFPLVLALRGSYGFDVLTCMLVRFVPSPGRFYAIAGMKQIFGLIVTKFDCTLSDLDSPRFSSWRTCNVPSANAPVVLRPRASGTE